MKNLLNALVVCAGIAQAAPPAKLTPVTAAALKKVIAARTGKVVAVNFWATYCPPCVAELSMLAKWQKTKAAKGSSLMFVSADDPSENAKAAALLKKKGWIGSAYIVGGDQSKFVSQFDATVKDSFGLPRTYIYNRKGKLVKTVAAEEGDKLEKFIDAALKK